MSPVILGLTGLIVFLILMLLRVPIGVAMALVGIVGVSYLTSMGAALHLVANAVYSTFFSYGLTTIPLFIFMGQILFRCGIGEKLYSAAYTWVGHLPGGMALATIGGCTGFAAVCGSPNATVATMATVSLPEMKRYNYDMALATGCVAAGGTLGILIPPSVTFIVYGIIVEQSIGKLFIAGILPGILLAGLFSLTIAFIVRRNPMLGPKGPPASWRERLVSLRKIWEVVVLFGLVLGGLFLGLCTPTEAAAVGAFGAVIISIIGQRFTMQRAITAAFDTLNTTCMVFVILGGAAIMNCFLALSKLPFELAGWISALNIPTMAVMAVIIITYVIGGCVMEALPLLMLTVPIFCPVIVALGFDPIWFGVLIVLVCQVGFITPPVGPSAYLIHSLNRDVPLGTIFRGAAPFLLAMIVCIIIVTAFPQIALFLPGIMY